MVSHQDDDASDEDALDAIFDELPGAQDPDETELVLIEPFDAANNKGYQAFRKRVIDPAVERAERKLGRVIDVLTLNRLVTGEDVNHEIAYRLLHLVPIVIADVTGCDHRALSFFSIRQALSGGAAVAVTRNHSRTSFPSNVDPHVVNAATDHGEENAQGLIFRELCAAVEGAPSRRFASHVHTSLDALRTDLRGSRRRENQAVECEYYRLKRMIEGDDEDFVGPLFVTAAGDIREVEDVDVWVNPENTLMEMARVFDTSISAIVRHKSANWFRTGERSDDYIRRRLAEKAPQRVMEPGEAIMTPCAGELSKVHRVKKVVHVAAVELISEAPGCGYRTVPDVGLCVRNALQEIDTHNRTFMGRGARRLRSVIFPLLGASEAPEKAFANVFAMVTAAIAHVETARGSKIEKIMFLAYSDEDRRLIRKAIRRAGRLKSAPLDHGA